MTPLDRAHAAMEAAPEDAAARLAFYARVADAELVLVLDGPAAGDRVRPRLLAGRRAPADAQHLLHLLGRVLLGAPEDEALGDAFAAQLMHLHHLAEGDQAH